jgi:hypothetical protein
MTIDLHQLTLLAVLCTAIHWLFARSAIMKWFWDLRWWPKARTGFLQRNEGEPLPSRLIFQDQGPLALPFYELLSGLLACTACAGWWLGLGAGLLGIWPLRLGPAWINVLGAGLTGVVIVPILEGALIWGLRTTRIK